VNPAEEVTSKVHLQKKMLLMKYQQEKEEKDGLVCMGYCEGESESWSGLHYEKN
jgi:hypothetical protein